MIKPHMAASDLKAIFAPAPARAMSCCCQALSVIEDLHPVQYMLTILYDAVREDSSFYALFEITYKEAVAALTAVIKAQKDVYASDTAAYLLTAIMAQETRTISGSTLSDTVSLLTQSESSGALSQLGVLDGIANLLKSTQFRKEVWISEGVSERIFAVPKDAPPALLYKSIFCFWLLSFDEEIAVTLPQGSLKNLAVVSRLKDVLTICRVEKVVRLCLSTLKNLLKYKKSSEEIVEKGTLEVVNALEFEKWRDGDLYDDIRDLSYTISTAVKELSNFERYEKELASGELNWRFIHSDRFWQENVTKFEKDNYKAIGDLGKIVIDKENYTPTTLAVACHDIGEFAALHPMGKRKVSEFMVKECVMQLMNDLPAGSAYREVRREALLCCQKIMLDRW